MVGFVYRSIVGDSASLTVRLGISFLYALWHSPVVRSHLTLDDVDFTILAATSVLTDLMVNCPPAEACRDAFTRMAKATISMCMSTTGFGVASSLGSQALDSPISYVSPGQLSHDGVAGGLTDAGAEMSRPDSGGERRQIPKFDMNLRDLFSDTELQGRPQSFFQQFGSARAQQQQQQQRQQQQQPQDPGPFTGTTYTIPATPDTSAGTSASPLQQFPPTTQHQPQPDFPRPYQQPSTYQPPSQLSQTISHPQQPDFNFDTLDFLDTFPSDPALSMNGNTLGTNSSAGAGGNAFWPSGELDLGFGTGGLAGWEDGAGAGASGMEGVGAGGGGVDLFDGFFFGGGGTGGGFGG